MYGIRNRSYLILIWYFDLPGAVHVECWSPFKYEVILHLSCNTLDRTQVSLNDTAWHLLYTHCSTIPSVFTAENVLKISYPSVKFKISKYLFFIRPSLRKTHTCPKRDFGNIETSTSSFSCASSMSKTLFDSFALTSKQDKGAVFRRMSSPPCLDSAEV